ncbi:MAG: hypothetical protein MHM6MM_004044, partial [Cercozoa sp. M6MM]
AVFISSAFFLTQLLLKFIPCSLGQLQMYPQLLSFKRQLFHLVPQQARFCAFLSQNVIERLYLVWNTRAYSFEVSRRV